MFSSRIHPSTTGGASKAGPVVRVGPALGSVVTGSGVGVLVGAGYQFVGAVLGDAAPDPEVAIR
jgi:hypothetical protein